MKPNYELSFGSWKGQHIFNYDQAVNDQSLTGYKDEQTEKADIANRFSNILASYSFATFQIYSPENFGLLVKHVNTVI